jgi:hypothetical protein
MYRTLNGVAHFSFARPGPGHKIIPAIVRRTPQETWHVPDPGAKEPVMSNNPGKPKTIWTYAEAEDKKPSLVRLTADHLCLAVVPKADLEKTAASLEAGGDVVSQNIPLAKITGIEGNVEWADSVVSLTVTYRLSETKTETADFQLNNKKEWEKLSGSLLGRLGPGWERQEARHSAVRSALWPLGTAVVFALVTWWMYHEASLIAAGEELEAHGHGRTRLVISVAHLIEGWVGPTGVLIIGAVLVLACMAWLWYALAYPDTHVAIRSKEVS